MERLDKHFEKLTKQSFARYGFAYGELLVRWPEIVGTGLADCCEPERIKWPRGAGEAEQKLGGTLLIRAAAGRGLELQHQTHRIIERINQFYGYGAVTAVKITQTSDFHPKTLKKNNNSLGTEAKLALDEQLKTIADEKLKEALQRLGSGALAKTSSSPQG